MSLIIIDTRITSTVLDDQAVRCHDGMWMLGGPLLGPVIVVDRMQALAALTVADAIKSVHTGQPCSQCRAWLQGLRDLLTPQTRPVRCLYCGSTDVYETRVTVDDRTDEYALACGECHGVWAA